MSRTVPRLIRAIRALRPHLPQSASFDTAGGENKPRRRGVREVDQLLGQHVTGLKIGHEQNVGLTRTNSPDSRELLASDRVEAREAINVFTFRIAGEMALATTLGNLNAIVFTAGIGEHQPQIPAAVCERLARLGVRDRHRCEREER